MTNEEFFGRVLRKLGDVEREQHDQRVVLVRIEGFLDRHEDKLKAHASDIKELQRTNTTSRNEALDEAKAKLALREQNSDNRRHDWTRTLVALAIGAVLSAGGFAIGILLKGL